VQPRTTVEWTIVTEGATGREGVIVEKTG
jgi:hypothetical protein